MGFGPALTKNAKGDVGFPLALLDYGRLVAVSVIRAYRHSGSDWANSDTDTDIFRSCGPATQILAAAIIANTTSLNTPGVCAPVWLNPMDPLSFRPDRIGQWTALPPSRV